MTGLPVEQRRRERIGAKTPSFLSAAFDSDFLDLFLWSGGTRHRDFEYTLVEARLDLIGVRFERQLKAAHEFAERPFDQMILLLLVLLFLFGFVLSLEC